MVDMTGFGLHLSGMRASPHYDRSKPASANPVSKHPTKFSMKKQTLIQISTSITLMASALMSAISGPGPRPALAATAPAAVRSPESPTDVPIDHAIDGGSIATLNRTGSMLFWVSHEDCLLIGMEFGPPCKIRSKPTEGGSTRLIFNNTASGPVGNFIGSNNIAADDSFVYWADTSGHILRTSRSATASTPPITLASTEVPYATTEQLAIEVAVDASYVYWTESYFNGSSNVGKVFRAPKAGGSRELMRSYGNRLRDLKPDGNGSVYFIHAGIFIVPDILYRVSPVAGGTFTETAPLALVNSYALSGVDLFWAEGFNTSDRLVKSAPQNNTAAALTRATISGVGNPRLLNMNVDSRNIYWNEVRGSTSIVYRLALTPATGGTPNALTSPGGVADLTTDGRNLFWRDSQIVERLPTGAAAISHDLAVSALEVVQAVQRPANDVPLVSDKETFVRVFGNILSSSTGATSLNTLPMIQLHGTRGGNPLPDSPLLPTNFLPATSAAPDRTTLNNWLFRLPVSWADGSVTLRAEINPRRIQPESNYANNTLSRTVNFNRKAPVCVDVMPIDTVRGVSHATPGGLAPFFARARSALPTHQIIGSFRGGPPLRKPRWYLFESDPYSLTGENPDAEWLMFWMNAATLFGGDPANCNALNARTTRTAIIPNIPNREVNGMASGWSLVFFTIPGEGDGAQRTPAGGITFAHELGHSYGRGHVNCGNPSGVDSGYPYAPCQLDNDVSGSGHIGFDPLTQELMLPQNTGDLMSYSHLIDPPKTRWPSDYTWKGFFNALNNRSAALSASSSANEAFGPLQSRQPASATAAHAYLVSGIITGTNNVGMNHAYELTGTLLSNAQRFIGETTTPSAVYQLRAYVGSTAIAQIPLRMNEIEESLTDSELFNTLLEVDSPPDRIEIVKLPGTVLRALTAGPAAPVVTITSPSAGSVIGSPMNLAWNGTDPDGDLLRYVVRYSNDNGATWIVLEPSTTNRQLSVDMSRMPGGVQALVQVMASDGLHTTVATVGPINVAKHLPTATVMDNAYNELSPALGISAAQSETVVLRGFGYDAEDGELFGSRLRWQISGPITRTGDGGQLTLIGLPPGSYAVNLTATDSDGNVNTSSTWLTIAPKRIFDSAGAMTLDGLCNESAYDVELDPLLLRYADGIQTGVRLAHVAGALYACFAGMPIGGMPNSFAGLRFDLDNSGSATPQAGDRGFFVGRDGAPFSTTGNGTAWVNDALPDGVTAAVSEDGPNASWSAELRIPEEKLGGWNKLVRMRATHYWRDFGGDDTFWPAGSAYDVPRSWGLTALGALEQTINFGALPNRRINESPITLNGNSSSNLPLQYSSLTPAVCVVSGAQATLLSAGTCSIRAAQPGNSSYTAATPVDRSFVVTHARFLPLMRKA